MDFGIFENFVSLGHSCFIAQDLENIGLRNCSLPLDWVASGFPGVIRTIENHFSEFLKYDYLYQDYKHHHAYKNMEYDLGFYHDFKKELPLWYQINSVRKKYNRRIERFYEVIQKPTLFFRYIRDFKEIGYITENYDKIMALLKSFNSNNQLIFIADFEDAKAYDGIIPNLYHVEKDEGEKLTKKPITKNAELNKIFSELNFGNRAENLKFNVEKKPDTSLKYRFNVKLRKICKDYTHSKQTHI